MHIKTQANAPVRTLSHANTYAYAQPRDRENIERFPKTGWGVHIFLFFSPTWNSSIKHLCDFNGSNLKSLSHSFLLLLLLSYAIAASVFASGISFCVFFFYFYVDITWCIEIKLSTNSIHNVCIGFFFIIFIYRYVNLWGAFKNTTLHTLSVQSNGVSLEHWPYPMCYSGQQQKARCQ